MKNVFITLFLCLVLMPIAAEAQQTKKMGRLYEFIIDPADNNTYNTDKNTYINWARQNFDEYNIPLISTNRLTTNNGTSVVGIDSAFKYNPLEAQVRRLAWYHFKPVDNTNMPWLVYNPYWYWSSLQQNPLGFVNVCSVGVAQLLPQIKSAIDDAEAQTELGFVPAAIPLRMHSEFKNGSIVGTLSFDITAAATQFNNAVVGINTAQFVIQLVLAEGYHKYGTEEFYFIPRKYLYDEIDFGGGRYNMPQGLLNSQIINFDFPVDKSYNTKYLYVIAIAELYPFPVNANTRILLDAAVDRVVDVRNSATHTPLKLEVDYINPAHKCQKVPTGSTNNISFRITNPTGSPVKAMVYIDKNTSVMNGWTCTPNRTEVTIAAGGNQTVTIECRAPSSDGAAAIDFCVLPIDENENQNPIISNIMAVIATDSTKVLALSNDINDLIFYIAASSHYENISAIYDQYYSVIDPNMFDGYIFENTNYTKKGGFNPSVPEYPLAGFWVFAGSDNSAYTKQQQLLFRDLLDESKLKFLNSIISANKHLALFTDCSPYYSTIAPTATRNEYQTLFNHFGVTYKNERKTITANQDTIQFSVKGMTTESLAKKSNGNTLAILYNNNGNMKFVPYVTDWNITAPAKTSKVFYYDNELASTAAVKVEQGKLFLAGFGTKSVGGISMMDEMPHLFENIANWWLGQKEKLNPQIDVSTTSWDFGNVTRPNDPAARLKIPISNIATDPKDILKIRNTSRFINDYDGSFSVVKPLKEEIGPGEVDTLELEFYPQSGNEVGVIYNVTYRIFSNAFGESNYALDLNFTGKGFAPPNMDPKLEIDQSDLFVNLNQKAGIDTCFPLNSQQRNYSYYLYNSGGTKLEIYSIAFSSGTDTEVYTLQNSNIIDIEPQQYKILTLLFSPAKDGDMDGSIIINSNCSENSTLQLEFTAWVCPVSIAEEIAKMFSCNISPNPASDEITIDFEVIGELPRKILLNIVDNTGRLIKTISNGSYTPGNHKETINISDLPAGTYYIEYTVDKKKSANSISIVR